MDAHQHEIDFWDSHIGLYHNPEGNFFWEGFHPRGGYVADFTVVKKDKRYHLFHIERKSEGNCAWPGHETYFGHSSTEDFVKWKTHMPVMFIRPGTWEGSHVFAPYILEHENKYVMFYTGLNEDHAQSIGIAFSKDLESWERYYGNPVFQPAASDWALWGKNVVSSCRDPHVYVQDDKLFLYYTAVRKSGESCIALATSGDLVNWKDEGDVFHLKINYGLKPLPGPNHLESACVHEMGGKYYLFYGHNGGIRYNISDSLYDFAGSEGTMIWEGYTGIEVLERLDPVWLVSAFNMRSDRFFTGIIDWSAADPKVIRPENPSDIEIFYNRK